PLVDLDTSLLHQSAEPGPSRPAGLLPDWLGQRNQASQVLGRALLLTLIHQADGAAPPPEGLVSALPLVRGSGLGALGRAGPPRSSGVGALATTAEGPELGPPQDRVHVRPPAIAFQ